MAKQVTLSGGPADGLTIEINGAKRLTVPRALGFNAAGCAVFQQSVYVRSEVDPLVYVYEDEGERFAVDPSFGLNDLLARQDG